MELDRDREWSLKNVICGLGISVLGDTVFSILMEGFSLRKCVVGGVGLLTAIVTSSSFLLYVRRGFSKKIFLPLISLRGRVFVSTAILVSLIASVVPQYHQDRQLQQQATVLSAQILAFEQARTTGQPAWPRPETWREDSEKNARYLQSTMAAFSVQYGGALRTLCVQLEQRDLGDEDFRRLCTSPTNFLGIREVGQQLVVLADQLPRPVKWFSGWWAMQVCLSLVLCCLLWIVFNTWDQFLWKRLNVQEDNRLV